ncbi:MAG: PLP-dependent aminotransferase family protein [Syntrophomonadaceae bacterium]|nr:PLP-dependent aminotransferase family protein [Syntrophomonadaceae bacterium]
MDMLTFTIDTESKTPIYQQLYAFIKEDLLTGRIVCDTRLPSKRKLSSYLKISQNTIQSAYDQLIAEGYVYSLEKKGFFAGKIDNILKLDSPTDSDRISTQPEPAAVRYDFSHHGVDLHSFPFAVWRRLTREVIDEYDRELLQLGDFRGHYKLRAAIAAYLHQSRGVNCSADQIIISSGTELLMLTLIQLLNPASVYALEDPGYEKLNLLFSSSQAQFTAINIDEGGMIPEEICASPADVLCLTPAHQFPSGEIMPINRRIKLLNWANETHGRYIIEDDYDSEFKYSGKPVPALQGLDDNGKVIYMGAFSKSLTPALRISYMVLPALLLHEYIKKLSYMICPVPVIEQKVLCRFIEDGYFERHLNRMRIIYKRKRELLTKNIRTAGGDMQVSGADAGLHLLLKVNNGMSEKQLVTAALQQGIRVYGVSNYYLTPPKVPGPPTVLIGYAAIKEEEISDAVRLLHKAWFAEKPTQYFMADAESIND